MRRDLWSLDEYVVVADLYLRRGRSSGIADPEVVELAKLTGRTPSSISRRLGNFDGTARPGNGLKPVSGEALRAFEEMRADRDVRARMTVAATDRLRHRLVHNLADRSAPRLVDPENHTGDPIEVCTTGQVRRLEQVEWDLVRRYRRWLDPEGTRLRGIVIPVEDTLLRVDLYDSQLDLLIEAKADTSRNHLRQAVGQLIDYRRYLSPRPSLAILLPGRPNDDLMQLPHQAGIGLIWEENGGFVHPGRETLISVGNGRLHASGANTTESDGNDRGGYAD